MFAAARFAAAAGAITGQRRERLEDVPKEAAKTVVAAFAVVWGLPLKTPARNARKLALLCGEIAARAFACDAADADQVKHLFEEVEGQIGTKDVVVYNASARARGPVVAGRLAFMPRGFWPNGDKNDNGELVLNLPARRRFAFDYRDHLGLGDLAFLQ